MAGWMIGPPAGPDHLSSTALPSSRLTCHQPGADTGPPQLSAPVGADRHLAAHRLKAEPGKGWTGILTTWLPPCW